MKLQTFLLLAPVLLSLGIFETKAQAQQSVVDNVVEKALAYKAMLSSSQQTAVQKPYSTTSSRKWSNLPDFVCDPNCRNGVKWGNLNASQLAAAKNVVAAALGTAPEEGFDEAMEVRSADSVLGAESDPEEYSHDMYYLAFLNAPSTTGAWMLQFGGHHYAANIAYNKGAVVGTTPLFLGTEPIEFTLADKRVCKPLHQEAEGFQKLLASLTTSQAASAKLPGRFDDVVLGAGEDGKFPATKVGVKVSSLTALQQSLVLAAMEPYLQDADSVAAASLRAIYASELADTYISYTGKTTLKANGDYVRIDGPSVWIEMVCQDGVVYPDQIHYHSVWRDHKRDYGKELTLEPTTVAAHDGRNGSGRPEVKFSIASSPNLNILHLALHTGLRNGTLSVLDAKGERVLVRFGLSGKDMKLNIESLPKGIYAVRLEDEKVRLISRFARL